MSIFDMGWSESYEATMASVRREKLGVRKKY